MPLVSIRQARRWCWLATLLAVLLSLTPGDLRANDLAVGPDDRFGLDFVNAQNGNFSNQSQRYARANQAGAGWDRWVIYWNSVEKSCNQSYDWSATDPVVNADVAQGLAIDAVLLGTPGCYATATTAVRPAVAGPHGGLTSLATGAQSVPTGLNAPVFADGTDSYQPGKALNRGNPWGFFVYSAVSRYQGRIENWEIWNEPDYSAFWGGTVADYTRLLKVAYLAAHAADPAARILVGGMMYWEWANRSGEQSWLKAFLQNVTADPAAAANRYYFDVIPWHWYSRSSDAYDHTLSAARVLASYGITGKELWINETNAPACDETVNGTTFSCTSGAPGYATDLEQASFILQSLANGFAAGATKIFEFQLQDDGNPQALGAFRNDGSARPIYQAYQVAEQNFAGFSLAKRSQGDGWVSVTFGIPGPNPHRTTVLWNDTGQWVNAVIGGAGVTPSQVRLIQQDGTTQSVTPGASYQLGLAPATDNRNWDGNPNEYIIGGPTVLLVESLPPDQTPPGSRVTQTTKQSNGTILVQWNGSDPGGWGVADYTIQYRNQTAGGAWVSWLVNTAATSATFTPVAGQVYQFRSLARDWAGNREIKCPGQSDVVANAVVTDGTTLRYKAYFPVLANGGSVGC